MDAPLTAAPSHVKLTWRHAGELLLALLALVAFWSWLSAHEDNVKAQALQSANEKVIAANDAQQKQNDAQIRLLTAQLAELKADQTRQLATVQATFSRAQTPDQSAALTALLLGLKTGEVKAGGTAAAPTIDAPRAQLQAYEQVCEECKVKLPNLTAQLANVTSQLGTSERDKQLLANDLLGRTQERDQWKKAAKGGSFLQRLTRAVKYIGIGAAAGAVALCASGHCK